MIAEQAQGWDRIEKRLDLGSARSDSQQNNYVSQKRRPSLSPQTHPFPLSCRLPEPRLACRQRTSHISNPHHLTIVTLQNSSGYHPDVRHVHFAEQGKNAPLPPAPRLPLRMVRLYRL